MNTGKNVVTVFAGGVSVLAGKLAVPVILLLLCNGIDYATGLMAAGAKKKKRSPYKSVRGAAKKVCMWLLVLVGAIVDEVLSYATASVGLKLPFAFLVSGMVCLWLVCCEILSILKNISDIGVALPPFLKKIVRLVKKNIEDSAQTEEQEPEEKQAENEIKEKQPKAKETEENRKAEEKKTEEEWQENRKTEKTESEKEQLEIMQATEKEAKEGEKEENKDGEKN